MNQSPSFRLPELLHRRGRLATQAWREHRLLDNAQGPDLQTSRQAWTGAGCLRYPGDGLWTLRPTRHSTVGVSWRGSVGCHARRRRPLPRCGSVACAIEPTLATARRSPGSERARRSRCRRRPLSKSCQICPVKTSAHSGPLSKRARLPGRTPHILQAPVLYTHRAQSHDLSGPAPP